jgi:glycerate kinase
LARAPLTKSTPRFRAAKDLLGEHIRNPHLYSQRERLSLGTSIEAGLGSQSAIRNPQSSQPPFHPRVSAIIRNYRLSIFASRSPSTLNQPCDCVPSLASLSPMKVLIIPDKFKGTLTAQQAAEAIAAGWNQARPDDDLQLLPMSDGGDGFGEVISHLLGGALQHCKTVNAAHQEINAPWWWVPASRTAIVESAQVNGLAMLPTGKYHPFQLDTFGLGKMFAEIFILHPVQHLIVGIGGSATNDGGFGMALALGFNFKSADLAEIRSWTELESLHTILPPKTISRVRLTIATDVQNPLLGPEGAARIYGPQKGLTPADFPKAEACLQNLASTVKKDLHIDVENEPGTGAAGGLGYGLRAFLNAQFESGFHLFARLANLEALISTADLIVTAEGSIDASTSMGKGAGAVAILAKKAGKPAIALAGSIREPPSTFASVHSIVPEIATLDQALAHPSTHLRSLAHKAAEQLTLK